MSKPDCAVSLIANLQKQLRQQVKYNQHLSEENEELRKQLLHYREEREMSSLQSTWERYFG